jgi:hypothetical protein
MSTIKLEKQLSKAIEIKEQIKKHIPEKYIIFQYLEE